MRSEELQATGCAPAAVGDRQHRQRDADRVGERHRLALAAADARRAGDDRGENQAAAGHEDEPERQPEHEPASQIAARPTAEAGKRRSSTWPRRGNEQRCRDDEEERDRDVAQEILGR